MAKQEMKRSDDTHAPHSKYTSVNEIRGAVSPSQKIWHTKPFSYEKLISPTYSAIDNDLARDNLENDITAADLQDLDS